MLRILLADRLASTSSATRLYLSRYADEWQVVGEAEDETALLAQVTEQCPDVVILHVGLTARSLSDLIAALRINCPDVGVLVSSGNEDMKTAVLSAGADAFMYLGDPPTKLVTKLRILQSERMV
jgi:DNA-binding NarL/FixJ family response regulator